MSRNGEFEFIAQSLAPLSDGYGGAYGLSDDAALLDHIDGLVVTSDTLVQGVHFRNSDRLDQVARKVVRVNLSDLAAMAATPHALMLSIVWPDNITQDQQSLFVAGLVADLDLYSLPLIGGDTTRGGDRLIVTATAFGETEQPLRRSGARPGDVVFVTGTIGDAALGLNFDALDIPKSSKNWLNDRYLIPEPRLEIMQALKSVVTGGLDVSDGLVSDSDHLAKASDVKIKLNLDQLPLSDAASQWANKADNLTGALVQLATGGDDYEILFCAPENKRKDVIAAAAATGVVVTPIGVCEPGAGVEVRGGRGEIVQILRTGFTHF